MRRIALGIMGTISGLVLLFSYHTSTNSQAAVADSTPSSGTPSSGTPSGGPTSSSSAGALSGSSGSSGSSSASSSSPSLSSTASSKPSGTYTGDPAATQWGTVQVRITVKNGTITQAEAVQYPNGNPRDQEINAYAVPTLNQEVVQKQSGSIDAVSGATVTSDGYLQSLQSAIDQAHL